MGEDELYETEAATGYRWHWSFLVVRILAFIASLFGVTGSLFGGIAADLTEHVNYKNERDDFAATAGRELETLLEGSDEE